MKRYLPYIAILTAMVIWGCAGILTKIALTGFMPLTLVVLRFLMAVSLMLLVGLASKQLQRIDKKDIPLFLLGGFFQPFLYYVAETYGMRLCASPTVAEVLLSTSPLFAPLFAFVLLREKVTRNNIIGILLSTAGVMMMVLAGNDSFDIGSPWAVLLLFLAVFAAVLYTIVLRKLPARYNAISLVFYVQCFALLFFLPTWAVVDVPTLLKDGFVFVPQAFWAVVALAVFASVVAFILFCYTVRKLGVTQANAFNNIRPVFTALFMLCLFGEQLPLLKWIGMAVVIIGLFICQKRVSA